MSIENDYRTKKGRSIQGRTDSARPSLGQGRAGAPAGASKEVMFKVMTYGKSPGSAKNMINYIVNESEHVLEGQRLYDETGREYTGKEVQDILDQWNLIENADNLTKKAREASPGDRADMALNDRLRERQTVHMVFSFPADSGMTARDMKDIVGEAMARYSDAGHRYVMSPHLNADNPHMHVVMKVRSEYGDKVRIDRDEIHLMRDRIREAAKDRGYEMDATRKTRRHGRRDKTPLDKTVHGKRAPDSNRSKGVTNLERQVPQWYARHGYAHEAGRRGLSDKLPEMRPVDAYMPKVNPMAEKALRDHFSNYTKPEEARQSFLEMMADNKKTAYWYANNRPEIFGELKQPIPNKLTERQLGLNEEWFRDAARTLDRAITDEVPEKAARRRELSHAMVENRLGEALRKPDNLDRAVNEANRDMMYEFGKAVSREWPKMVDRFKESGPMLRKHDKAKDDFAKDFAAATKRRAPRFAELVDTPSKGRAFARQVAKAWPEASQGLKRDPEASALQLGKALAARSPEVARIADTDEKARALGRVVQGAYPKHETRLSEVQQRLREAEAMRERLTSHFSRTAAEHLPELIGKMAQGHRKQGQKIVQQANRDLMRELGKVTADIFPKLAERLRQADSREAPKIVRAAEKDLMKDLGRATARTYERVNDQMRGIKPRVEEGRDMLEGLGQAFKDRVSKIRDIIKNKGGGAYDRATDGVDKARDTGNESAGIRARGKEGPDNAKITKVIDNIRPGRDRGGRGSGGRER